METPLTTAPTGLIGNQSVPGLNASATELHLTAKLRQQMKTGELPGVPEDYTELYTLMCKKGAVMLRMIFWHGINKVVATEAGRKYCERHHLRFIWVERFCIDIEAPFVPEKDRD